MNTTTENMCEQLSAMMDGELSDAESRFLLRRLEHDDGLRNTWSRMQLASSLLRRQPVSIMDSSFGNAVAAGVRLKSPTAPRRPALLRWAVAASIVALALTLSPRFFHGQGTLSPRLARVGTAADHVVASPSSADLVAERVAVAAVLPSQTGTPLPTIAVPGLVASASPAPTRITPLPLSAQTPSEFPLVDRGGKRSWPKSELVSQGSDPAMEAYLVRHNQMLANDGLGGFVPYVDVVTSDPSATAAGVDAGDGDDGAVTQ